MVVLAEVKKAVIVFNYAEKIKTSLIVASSLLDFLCGLKDEAEVAGAEKLLAAYFNALILEVHIAVNSSKIEGFRDIALKLEEVAAHLEKHSYANIYRLISEAISAATTCGNWAAQLLSKENLI